MLTKELLTERYYVNKMSLFMQNDELLAKRFHNLYLFLKDYAESMDSINSALESTIYDILYPSNQANSISDDLLEKIAAIFNISRVVTVNVDSSIVNTINTTFNLTDTNYEFSTIMTFNLTNDQMKCLIYASIMKNAYDGSRSSIKAMYALMKKSFLLYGKDIYVNIEEASSAAAGTCTCYMDISGYDLKSDESNNYIKLFIAGMLTTESMGIAYTYAIINNDLICYFDSLPEGVKGQTHFDTVAGKASLFL